MDRSMRTTSAGQRLSAWTRLREEGLRLWLVARQAPDPAQLLENVERDINTYAEYLRHFGNTLLSEARILEIGHGQRPLRLIHMLARGHDVTGIDLDYVVLNGSVSEFLRVYKLNGLERSLKTCARWLLWDRKLNSRIASILGYEWKKLSYTARQRLLQGDASVSHVWPRGQFDLIYSEDVFEHVPREGLERLCRLVADRLTDRGIAVIRPMVWTGILGGHRLEWYASGSSTPRSSPWGHLIGEWEPPNTYLNRLTRREYVQLFQQSGLDVLVDEACEPTLGKEHASPDIMDKLKRLGYDEYELFSNKVTFVLRIKRRGQCARRTS